MMHIVHNHIHIPQLKRSLVTHSKQSLSGHSPRFRRHAPFRLAPFSTGPLRRSKSTHINDRQNQRQDQRYNIVFFGSCQFSVRHLEKLIHERNRTPNFIKSINVITPPDKRKGRGLHESSSPLKQFSMAHHVPVFDAPPKTLNGWNLPPEIPPPDIAIVVSFNYFIPASLIKQFPVSAINVHPSLLPKYRGAAPIQWTLMNGDTETGVSIIDLHPTTFDAGRVLNQTRLAIPDPSNIRYSELESILADEGSDLLIQTLRNLDAHKASSKSQEQLSPNSDVPKAPKITKELGLLSWDIQTAQQIWNLYRGVSHQIPLQTTFKSKPLHLTSLLHPVGSPPDLPKDSNAAIAPGTIYYNKHSPNVLYIRAKQDWAVVEKVKVVNRKEVGVKEWMNGYKVRSLEDRFGL